MLTIRGKYKNGLVTLEDDPKEITSGEVIVTFLESNSESVSKTDKKAFHFEEAREASKTIQGKLSDTIIEDRKESN
ncbi:MAG: hypothetical protein RIC80_10805 [Cyclobacteriaceae bacterium]